MCVDYPGSGIGATMPGPGLCRVPWQGTLFPDLMIEADSA